MKMKYQVAWADDTVVASANWSDAASPVIFTYVLGCEERRIEPYCCNVASFGHDPAVALRTALEMVAKEEGVDVKLVDVAIEAMTCPDDLQHSGNREVTQGAVRIFDETYQIYINRRDDEGLALDGCWGSEDANYNNLNAAKTAADELAKQWPACDFVVKIEKTEVCEYTAKGMCLDEVEWENAYNAAVSKWLLEHLPELDVAKHNEIVHEGPGDTFRACVSENDPSLLTKEHAEFCAGAACEEMVERDQDASIEEGECTGQIMNRYYVVWTEPRDPKDPTISSEACYGGEEIIASDAEKALVVAVKEAREWLIGADEDAQASGIHVKVTSVDDESESAAEDVKLAN